MRSVHPPPCRLAASVADAHLRLSGRSACPRLAWTLVDDGPPTESLPWQGCCSWLLAWVPEFYSGPVGIALACASWRPPAGVPCVPVSSSASLHSPRQHMLRTAACCGSPTAMGPLACGVSGALLGEKTIALGAQTPCCVSPPGPCWGSVRRHWLCIKAGVSLTCATSKPNVALKEPNTG